MGENLLINVIANMSDVLLFAWFAASMIRLRRPKVSLTLGVLLLGLAPMALNMFLPKPFMFPIALVSFWIFLRLAYEGTLKERILVYSLGYTTINVAQILCGSVFGILGVSYEEKIFLFWTICAVFEFSMLFLVSRTWKSIKLVLSNGRFIPFFLLPVSQYLMMLVFVYYFSKRGTGEPMDLSADHSVALAFGAVFLLSLIADGLFLDSMRKLAGDIREHERLQTLEMESELTYEYIKSMESDISEMSKYRHDIVNILTAAQLAIEAGGGQGEKDALELLRQMTDEVSGVTGKRYCACNIVNCILAREEKRMTESGIMCELRAELPERLGVSELDLCRVLTNLFDNAEDNCCRIENESDRHVSSNMRVCEGFLYITVRNTFPEGQFSLETSKENRKLHGLGLKIIRQIAERNNGELIISQEDNAVTITVTMEWKEQ